MPIKIQIYLVTEQVANVPDHRVIKSNVIVLHGSHVYLVSS